MWIRLRTAPRRSTAFLAAFGLIAGGAMGGGCSADSSDAEAAPDVVVGVFDTAAEVAVSARPDAAPEASVAVPTDAGPPAEVQGDDSAEPADVPSVVVTPPPVVVPAGLKGQTAEPLELPEFAGVVDSTSTPVVRDQLVGKWTAMWFYPLATTAG